MTPLFKPVFLCVFALMACVSALPAGVDFAQDVQPIFARHCYECHGAEKQKGKLRLDARQEALQSGAIVPGKANQSDLYRRINLPKGHEDIMPSRGEPLSKAQIGTIAEWINAGAEWPENVKQAKHWAYLPPVRPTPPDTRKRGWTRNEIDQFILAKLEHHKLRPSAMLERERLLRRVYLDLIGLPPSPAQVEAFLGDTSPDAYEKVVDQLLASPHYGERWARPWLDAARYADSLGFQRDDLWDLWPYRDWVIKAFNADMPFDQFTIEQIAGDLLPGSSDDQKVATGFNRCTPTNIEAGADQEETRVNQVFDRVNTVGTIWLGTTLECAQCHNHKYDPFSQKEYYELFAFFNNTPKETDFQSAKATAALRLVGPHLNLPDPATEQQAAALNEKIKALDQKIEPLTAKLVDAQEAWEKQVVAELADAAQVHVLEVSGFEVDSDSGHQILEDKSVLLQANDNAAIPARDIYTVTVFSKLTDITGFKLEVLTDPSLPGGGPGRGDEKNPNFVLTDFRVTAQMAGSDKRTLKLANAAASFEQRNFPAANAIDDKPRTGWAINPEFFKDHWATFELRSTEGSADGTTFTFKLHQEYGGGRTIGRLRFSAITGKATGTQTLPVDIVAILKKPAADRSKSEQTRLTNFYLSRASDLAALKTERTKLAAELKRVRLPRTLVMEELDKPRASTMFVRGSFLEKGEPVQPAVPAILHPLPDGQRTRLALAQWLTSTNNPLVARVTVNRWWLEMFGQGLVATPEDFGIKGELPTHPDLLDWLAVEFMERGWSMKHIHRLIATSATYRQSSKVTPALLKADDQNKLYARGPRFRMDAEMIRDSTLAATGLLSLKMGGPPVRPYQPPGIWESKVGGEAITYETSEGEDQYRRGLYTVWKRTSPYPSFITFDAPNRNSCAIKRTRSNTPLQSLTLLNDPVYVEAAQALATRVLKERSAAPLAEQLRFAFQLCTSRQPSSNELRILTNLFQEQLKTSRGDLVATGKLVTIFAKDIKADPAELSAWYSIATALLNLDETITKG
jgi:hypothetical protein